jgi:hypothetical protein
MTQSRFHASDLSLAGARHRGLATLAALLLALALLAAGCGGGKGGGGELSKTQYESRIQKDAQEIRDAFTPLSTAPASLKEFASEIKAGQEKLGHVADDLESVTPPAAARRDNERLAAGLRKLASLLEPLRRAALKANPVGVRDAAQNLQNSTALKDAQQAIKDLKKKGYDLGSLG